MENKTEPTTSEPTTSEPTTINKFSKAEEVLNQFHRQFTGASEVLRQAANLIEGQKLVINELTKFVGALTDGNNEKEK